MKNILLTCLLYCISIAGLSQSSDEKKLVINFDNESIGKNLMTNQDIPSRRIRIEGWFSKIHYDSTNNIIHALIKEYESDDPKAELICIDLKSNQVLWQKEVNLEKNKFTYDDDVLVLEEGKKLYTYDLLTFQKKWEVPSKIYAVFPNFKIGITMNETFWHKYKDGLMGIDLHTGQVKWTNESIKLKNGVNLQTFVKDSNFYFINDKLYGLNVITGKHWESDFSFYKNCGNSSYTGYCAYCSNFAFDSTYFYIAQEYAILKYDYDGKLISEMKYPNMATASMSKLYITDTTLILVNKGFTILASSKINTQETPFVAIYSKTGENRAFFSFIDDDIIKSDIVKNELFLHQKKALHVIDINKKEIVFSKEVPKKKMKIWYKILNESFYHQVGNQFNFVTPRDSTKFYIFRTDDKIDIVDKEFNVLGEISEDSIHYVILKDSLFEALYNIKLETTTILDKSKNKLLELSKVRAIFKRNEQIFIATGNRIYIVKIKDLE